MTGERTTDWNRFLKRMLRLQVRRDAGTLSRRMQRALAQMEHNWSNQMCLDFPRRAA